MPTYRPIPGETDTRSAMPMNSPPMDDLTMMARERASNILMPYAQTGIPASPTSPPGSPGVNPTPGVTAPTATAPGVEDKLYQAVHPDTFSKVLELIMQFVTGKPIPRQAGGEARPSHAYLVGEERPELFVPDQPGEIIPMQEGGRVEPPTYSPFDPFRQRDEMAEATRLRELAGVTYNPNTGPLTQPGGLGGALEEAGWTGTMPGTTMTPTETPTGTPNLPAIRPVPPAGGYVAPPYTGPRPWQNRAPDFAVSHTPGEYPIAKAGDWQDYGEGIRYKLGPEDVRGDEMARQRILREATPTALPKTTLRSYYEAHPEERFYDESQGEQSRLMEMYRSARTGKEKNRIARMMEANAQVGERYYKTAIEGAPGSPQSQERLAHAQYYREEPGARLASTRETNIAHLQGIRDQVAGHLEVAKIGAGQKDQILKGLETFLQKGSERAAMTNLPFDLQKEAAGYITVMKDLGYIAQEQYDKLPDTYKEKRWTEQSLRADLKKNGMIDKDIETYIKRARAAGRI